MKQYFLLLVLAGSYLPVFSQVLKKKYKSQYGVGYFQTPRPIIFLDQGEYPIRPVRMMGLMLNYKRRLRSDDERWNWGLRGALVCYQGWWDLKKGNTYYNPPTHSFTLEKLDHVELYVYSQRSIFLSKNEKYTVKASFNVGPAFNFNSNLNAIEGLVPLRTDTRIPFLACEVSHERRQPVWVPYLRFGGGFDISLAQSHRKTWILNPFIEGVIFQSDKETFTSFPTDPRYLSKGHFKWNRIVFGCTLGFSK